MATTSTAIDIQFFENESCVRQFTLRTGNADSNVPLDLTDAEFESEIRDAKKVLVLRMTTGEGDNLISKVDAPNGVFSMRIPLGAIAFNPKVSLKYDLLMRLNGDLRRLWGGSVRVLDGTTVPA